MADKPKQRGRQQHSDSLREPALAIRMGSDARRLSSQHEQLDLFYGMLVESLQRGSLRGARVAFVRFHDALDAHMAVEDNYFFPTLRGLRPDVAGELESLVNEHTSIRLDLDHLHNLLAEGSLDECLKRLERFATELSAHEEREEALLRRVNGAGHHAT